MFIQQVAWPDLRIGDVFYVMGKPSMISVYDWRRLRFARWFKDLVDGEERWFPELSLERLYSQHLRELGEEPNWLENLPTGMKYWFRQSWLMGDQFEPLAILPYRQDLGFSFAVEMDGLVHDVCQALNIFRLEGIRQLGFLHDPTANEVAGEVGGICTMFNHTRYMHSLTVMATASLCGTHVGLSQYELKHLRAAALSHDTLTPAGGDSIKLIDYAAMDEDAHYANVFKNNSNWERVREKHGLSEKLLTETVQGKGVLGRLLDFADKTSYVAHDVDMYLMGNDPRSYKAFVSPESLMTVWRQRESSRGHACALWNKLRLQDGDVVVTDGRKLAEFLKLRALMFKHLYFNPHSRYREHLLAVLLAEPLYREGVLTRDMLITMNDNQLEAALEKRTGVWNIPGAFSNTDFAPTIESFATLDEARQRAAELTKRDRSPVLMVEQFPQPSAKAMDYLVSDHRGRVRRFADAYPEEAAEILEIGADPEPCKLYVLDREKVVKIVPKAQIEKILALQEEKYNSAL